MARKTEDENDTKTAGKLKERLDLRAIQAAVVRTLLAVFTDPETDVSKMSEKALARKAGLTDRQWARGKTPEVEALVITAIRKHYAKYIPMVDMAVIKGAINGDPDARRWFYARAEGITLEGLKRDDDAAANGFDPKVWDALGDEARREVALRIGKRRRQLEAGRGTGEPPSALGVSEEP